jgi:hypothetical protein
MVAGVLGMVRTTRLFPVLSTKFDIGIPAVDARKYDDT